MHLKVMRFLELTKEHKEILSLLCELSQTEADLEHQMVLNYLEFSDNSNNYAELLSLEIENETVARELSELVAYTEVVKSNIEITRQAIQNLL